MKIINEDTMHGVSLTPAQESALRSAMNAGKVKDEFGDTLVWDEVTDCHGDIVLEQGGFDNCKTAAGIK